MKQRPEVQHANDQATLAYYEEHAKEYARTTQPADLTTLWGVLERALPQGALVGDLGSGAGRDLKRFGESGLTPIGLDRSFALSRIAWNYAARPLVVGDIRVLPFRDSAFDAIWCVATLLHLDVRDVVPALQEIHRVLLPSGLLIVTLKEHIHEISSQPVAQPFREEVDSHGRRMTYYTEAAARSLLRDAGFRNLRLLRSTEARSGRPISWLAFVAQRGR